MPDIYPADFETDVGKVRLLAGDTAQLVDPANPGAGAQYLFSDDEIAAMVGLFPTLHHAAARLVDLLAQNEALVSKKIRTEDLQTDGASVANSLRASAIALRAAGDDFLADAEGDVEIVDFVDPWRNRWF